MVILVVYGVGPRTERILYQYWEHLLMVSQAGRYYIALSKGCQGFAQGDPISPTIFNMELESVIWHWLTVVTGEEAGPEVFGSEFQWLAALFYADNGILVSPEPARIMGAIDILTDIFNQVRLQPNARKRWELPSSHVGRREGTQRQRTCDR